MRTKTLLIAAAALAAAVTSSQAQTVYSQNIVGYVNTKLEGVAYGYNMVTAPLNGGTNAADQLMASSLTSGDTIFIWQGASSSFYNSIFLGPGQDPTPPYTYQWYDSNNNYTSAPALNPGQGFFYENNSGFEETNTFTGTVLLTNSQTVQGVAYGYNMAGSAIPYAGLADSTNFNLPLISGDTLFIWKGPSSSFYNSIFLGPGQDPTPPYTYQWYDSNNNYTSAPVLNVGQGFFYENNSGGNEQWNESLNIP